jgi:hypothetical protein
MAPRFALVMSAAVLLAACQVPPAPPASPGPAAPSASPGALAAGLAFAPLTRDQVLRIRRRPGHDPAHAAATVVLAGWDAPPATRSGNWEFHVFGGVRAIGEGADAPIADATAVVDAAAPDLGAEDPATAFTRLARTWAEDAQPADAATRVVSRTLAVDLPLLPAPEVSGDPAPVPLVFVSQARGETLTCYGAGATALVVRTRWTAEPAPAEAKVAPAQATAALEAAIADVAAKGLEAETGRDWFLDLPFENGDRLPVGCLEMKAAAGAELRVELEPQATLAVPVLERRLGKLVYRIQEDASQVCNVGPTLETVFDQKRGAGFVRVHGAVGYVDAETGRVIRFRRNYRVYGVEGLGQPLDMFPGAHP